MQLYSCQRRNVRFSGAGQRLEQWCTAHALRVRFAEQRIAELRVAGAMDFAGLVVAVRELRKLRAL